MMTATRSLSRDRAIFCSFILLLAIGTLRLAHAKDARSPDNAYLDALQGDWDMTGTLLGKPAKYRARGQRVLHGGFLRLHMIDATDVPTYEADLFLGYDAHAGQFATYTLVHPAHEAAH